MLVLEEDFVWVQWSAKYNNNYIMNNYIYASICMCLLTMFCRIILSCQFINYFIFNSQVRFQVHEKNQILFPMYPTLLMSICINKIESYRRILVIYIYLIYYLDFFIVRSSFVYYKGGRLVYEIVNSIKLKLINIFMNFSIWVIELG